MTVRHGKSVMVWAAIWIVGLCLCAPAVTLAQLAAQANPGEISVASAQPTHQPHAPADSSPGRADQPRAESSPPAHLAGASTDRSDSAASADTPDESVSRSISDPIAPQERRPLGSRPADPDPTSDDQSSNRVGGAWMLQTALALVVVIGLIYLTRMVMRKMAGQSAQAHTAPIVEVLSRTPIAPKTHVMLLKLNHRIIVAAQSAGQVSALDSITDPDEVAQILLEVNAAGRNSVTSGFKSMLSKIDQVYQGRRSAEMDEGDDEDEQFVDRTRHEMSGLLSRIRQMTR